MSILEVDRGWAWLVLAASFMLHVIIYGTCFTTGVYNAIFLNYFDNDAATIAWCGSMVTAMSYLIAPVAGALTIRFGHRSTIIAGGLLASLGITTSFFATNIIFLFFSFGLVTGTGMGMAYLPGLACVALYFEKYRNLAMGIAVSGLGVGTFIFPPIITFLAHFYSWKGAMLVIGALTLNICACGFVIRPIRSPDFRRERKTPIFDVSVFRIEGYVLLCVCNLLISFGISSVYLQLTAFAKTSGISDEKAAMLISVIGIANLIGRFLAGAVGNHPKLNIFIVYSVPFVISGVAASFYPVCLTSYPAMIVLSVLFGFFTASYGALLPAVMIAIVGLQRLETGYGFLMLFMGIGHLAGGPFAGFVFDISGSYTISFYVGGALLMLSGVAGFFMSCLQKKTAIKTLGESCIIDEKQPLPA